MALKYRKSTKKDSRAYLRSKGMEPNPGVSHLAVVSNPGKRRRVSANPFQWIEGRGQGHRHVSPEFTSLRRAAGWKKRNKKSKARLYPVDEKGTIVSRPIKESLISNGGSEDMAYNIKALRRAMRSNPRGRVTEHEGEAGVRVSSAGRRKTKKNKRRSRRPTAKRGSRRRTSRRRAPVRRNSRRRNSRRRTSRRRKSRRSSRRRASVRRNSRRRTSRRRKSRRSSRRRTSVRRNSRRRTSRRSSRRRRSRSPMASYLSAGYMPAVAPRYRTGKSRSGIPPVLVYGTPKGRGKVVNRRKRRTTMTSAGRRRRSSYVGGSRGSRGRRKLAMNKRRRRTSRRRTSVRRNSRRRTSRRRKSRRSSRRRASVRRNSRRRTSRRRKSRRSSRRRKSRRSSRRLVPNLLGTARVRRGNRGMGRPVGGTYQVLAYGPGSRTSRGKRIKGYPVFVPSHYIETAAVRRYRGLGGAAKDNHARAMKRGYKERKKYAKKRLTRNSRRTSMRKNRRNSRRRTSRRSSRRRTSMRRNSRRRSTRRSSRRRSSRRRSSRRRTTRRNPRYIVANKRRRRRRVRKNGLGQVNWTKDVGKPILGGTAGFIGARVLSNGLANISAISGILDKGKPASEAENTKLAANALGILATLGLATKSKMIRDNQGALVTGMGLALADRLLGRISGPMGAYLGEYVNQPLGEYVNQPLGAYVSDPSMGEYVNQPLGDTLYAAAGLGAGPMEAAAGLSDPAEGLMDVMEAAAGMQGTMYATAGMGTMYATAGLGAEADHLLEAQYASEQPPFVSIQTPTSVAKVVRKDMPYADPVPESIVTPEGRGYAGGLFARNLFAGML